VAEEAAVEKPTATEASREGASGAGARAQEEKDEAEPPLSPGNGCVRGLVRFEDGEPLKGARVSLWGESKVYAVTDERGAFHLHDDWVAGRAVYLAGPNGVNGADPFGFILGPEVTMVEGETVRVEIVLKRGARVAAQVLAAATGDPVVGAEIELRRWDGDQMVGGQGAYGFAHTDAAGRFAFDHVVPADYSLGISARGLEAQYAHWDLRQRDLPDMFRLENARRLEIRVENAPLVAVGKEVKWCLQLSHFKDGKVVPRQELFMLDAAGVMQEGGLLVGDAPPPGRYDLTLWRTDILPQTEQKELILGDAPVETLTVAVAPGAPVEGIVRWPDQTPVEGAVVLAAGVSAKTDPAGRYAFAWLPGALAGTTAEFKVRLGRTDFPMGERTFEATEPRVLDFTLPGRGTVRFELRGAEAGKFGGIEIRLPGETRPVLERRIDPPITAPIVLKGVPAGPVRLYVWQWARSWLLQEIHVEDAGTLDLGVIEFPSWPRTEIRVRVPTGKNLPPWVLVYPTKDPGVPHGWSEMVTLDREGKGILPSQPPGLRRVLVTEPFGASVTVEFTVDPERPQPVEVLLDPG
jgi:hypothetical protein